MLQSRYAAAADLVDGAHFEDVFGSRVEIRDVDLRLSSAKVVGVSDAVFVVGDRVGVDLRAGNWLPSKRNRVFRRSEKF